MNDLKAVLEAFHDAGFPPGALTAGLMVFLGCWLFRKFVDMLHEAGRNNRAKYDWLVESLGKATVQQSRYLVEQAYARYMAVDAIEYDDLEALLKRKDPSLAVQKFVAHRRYVVIRRENSEFAYKPNYTSAFRRGLLKIYYVFMYFFGGGCAAVLGFMLYNEHLLLGFYFIGPVGFVGWAFASLSHHQDLSEAMEFMEPGSQRFWPRFHLLPKWNSTVMKWLRQHVSRMLPIASPTASAK